MIESFFVVFLKYKYLLFQLTQRAIKARYKQSIVGYFWIILNPLMQLVVYSFVFSIIFRFPLENIPYPIFLLVGLLPWIFFQTSLSSATTSLVENSDLLRKVYFPREVFIYSLIFSKAIDFFFASLLFALFMIFYQVPLNLSILYFIPLLLIQIALTTGLSLIFSTFNLVYRDIQYLINLVLMLWMYLTPIVYPLSLVPEKYLTFYKLNPMVGIVEGYRSAIFGLPFDIIAILWSIIFSLFILIIGFLVFKRSEKVFADIV